jgi:hypothetical protein
MYAVDLPFCFIPARKNTKILEIITQNPPHTTRQAPAIAGEAK